MVIQQIYTNCLSEAAYFIADQGTAVVIDPLRDVDAYLQLAKEHKATIKYIFETHFHADFVSGHLDLAKKTGATIVYGPQTNANFDFLKAEDGQEFLIGSLKIKVLHTPGHTLESTCYLLHDENGKPHCIFTGDTLFVGDVGRPDLFSGNLSKEDLAGMLFESLQAKILPLPDEIIVYPAHGPGSACGKNLGKETFSTLGVQKQTNYALKMATKEDFVKSVTDGLSSPPPYFAINAKINAEGYGNIDEVIKKGLTPLSLEAFDKLDKEEFIILDTRPATVFTQAFIPQSISIGLDGRFAEWAGSLLPFDQKIVLITELGKERESVVRLARVGLDNVIGYLEGGLDTWIAANRQIDMIIDIEADELAMDIPFDNKLQIIDVRKISEFENGYVKGAQNVPLSDFANILNLANFDEDANLYVHCAGGYRSVIACSILKKEGYHNLRNVLGGYAQIKTAPDIITIVPQQGQLN